MRERKKDLFNFKEEFLLSFRTFMTPQELLATLFFLHDLPTSDMAKKRSSSFSFPSPSPLSLSCCKEEKKKKKSHKPLQCRLLDTILHWITVHPTDWVGEPENLQLRDHLLDFLLRSSVPSPIVTGFMGALNSTSVCLSFVSQTETQTQTENANAN